YCNDKKILRGYNDLATTHPQLIEEWCVIENLLFGVGSMSDYLCTSTKRVWWKCKDCGNKYKMSIVDRVLKDKRHHKACDRCADRMRNRHMYM
ncbi:MAG: zinc-ribbon domain-containing protein, partial [Solobacterium sp.]|nr:zinc-ribbon domain-containing protein [Solobacterium sp.]